MAAAAAAAKAQASMPPPPAPQPQQAAAQVVKQEQQQAGPADRGQQQGAQPVQNHLAHQMPHPHRPADDPLAAAYVATVHALRQVRGRRFG